MSLPECMSFNETKIKNDDLPDQFAKFFTNKINSITSTTQISNTVYNGKKKLDHPNSFFMTEKDILDCLCKIKIKNCEGFDRIPQRVLVHGAPILIHPLRELFQRVYYQNSLPEQWLSLKSLQSIKKVRKTKSKIIGQ